LDKLWCNTICSTDKYSRSKKFTIEKCKILGTQEHFIDHCELTADLRRNLRLHGLVCEDKTLFKQIKDSRMKLNNIKTHDYHTLVGLYGRYVGDAWSKIRSYFDEYCLVRANGKGQMSGMTSYLCVI